MTDLETRIRSAWEGRISGCQLGKPVEVVSMLQGYDALADYFAKADCLPLRDYLPLLEGTPAESLRGCCRGHITRSEPDDDINYSVLALMMLEEHGRALTTEEVGRAWLKNLPAAWVFTAERVAYRTLLSNVGEGFTFGAPAEFDLSLCSDHEYADWIGAQIRADVYGWVCPGDPDLAADLSRRDAELSHRGDGVAGAMFVAALGAAIPASESLDAAVEVARHRIPEDGGAARAVDLGRSLVGDDGGDARIRDHYAGLSPVHTNNNLAIVVWALLRNPDDFSAAIGEAVAAGLDTDCNGATVGGLWGLQGKPVPAAWTTPWQGRVRVTLAGQSELALDDLVARTTKVAHALTSP